MNIKLRVGKIIDNVIDKLVKINYKLTAFIPNGRILPLDLKRANVSPRVIFDVGANVGQTANYFIQHFPNVNIFCFEPVLSVYNELTSNIADTQIKCFNSALGDIKSQATIYKSNAYSGISSINGIHNENFSQEETIEIDTGINVCHNYQISFIDILKIDTEGYELNVLKGFEPMLKNQVRFIYIEVGFDQKDLCKTHISDVLSYLSPYGFIPSGFYNPYRLGHNKLKLNHYDLLLTNTALIDV